MDEQTIRLAQALMNGSDQSGYSEDQAYRGRWRNPAYSSGAVEHAIGPVDFITPMGVGAGVGGLLGYGAGRAIGSASGVAADLMFPTIRAIAGSAGAGAKNWGGRIGAAYGGGLGTVGGFTAADQVRDDRFRQYLESQLPPRPIYPTNSPE